MIRYPPGEVMWRTIALAALAIAPGGAERDWRSVTRETLDTWRSPSCQALIAQSLTARDQPCGKRARSSINAWCNATSTGFLKNPKADSKGVRDHVEAQCASGVLPADKMDVVMIRPVENRTRSVPKTNKKFELTPRPLHGILRPITEL